MINAQHALVVVLLFMRYVSLTDYDALGEYTGVKPDEFLTLDKRAMESSGQIMYDSNTQMMTMGRGNSCSTLSRDGRISSHPSGPMTNHGFTGPMDYNTGNNPRQNTYYTVIVCAVYYSAGSVNSEILLIQICDYDLCWAYCI